MNYDTCDHGVGNCRFVTACTVQRMQQCQLVNFVVCLCVRYCVDEIIQLRTNILQASTNVTFGKMSKYK